jgi:hypothetical protein
VLALRDGALEPAGSLAAAPLCAGEAGAVFGAFAPGTGVYEDALARSPDAVPAARSPRFLYGVAAAPHGGPVAFAALGTDLRLELLGADLRPAELATSTSSPTRAPASHPLPPLLSIGSGFALADLDEDGVAEIVASAPVAGPPDRVRALAADAGAPPILVSGPIAGTILAGAGGDLTGDGVDDAVLAAIASGPEGVSTELLLVTTDPRELR